MLDQANISVKVIIQAKQDLINTMTAKLDCQDKTPKMHWLIFEKKNKKKRYQIYHFRLLVLLVRNIFQIFVKNLKQLSNIFQYNASLSTT